MSLVRHLVALPYGKSVKESLNTTTDWESVSWETRLQQFFATEEPMHPKEWEPELAKASKE
jgi:hypothetical protein